MRDLRGSGRSRVLNRDRKATSAAGPTAVTEKRPRRSKAHEVRWFGGARAGFARNGDGGGRRTSGQRCGCAGAKAVDFCERAMKALRRKGETGFMGGPAHMTIRDE